MRDLRTNTATRVTVGPFIDKTDGFTPETALTVTSEKLTFVVDTAGVPTLVLDVAPTASGGANDMVHITGDDSGFYDLELAAANVNYLGRAIMSINDVATHLPVFHEFMILSAEEYDAKYASTGPLETRGVIDRGTAQSATGTTLVLRSAAVFADDTPIGATLAAYGSTQAYWQTRTVTDYVLSTDTATVDTWTVTPSGTITYVLFAGPPASATLIPAVNMTQILGTAVATPATAGLLDVNVKQISTDATAADNAEAFFDGTGYAGTNNTIPLVTVVTTVNGLAADTITAAATATDFGAEIADAVWDEALSGHATSGTAGEALGEGYGVALGTAAVVGGQLIALGTIGSTGNDTTHLHLTGQPFGDDELNDHLIVVTDVSTSEKHARWITDWVNSTALATVGTLPFTPQNATDTYSVYAIRRDGTTTAVGTGGIVAASFAAGAIDAAAIAANAIGASELATDAVTEIANAVVEAEIDALETYNRTSNTAATITGPTAGATTLTIATDATYEPIKSIT